MIVQSVAEVLSSHLPQETHDIHRLMNIRCGKHIFLFLFQIFSDHSVEVTVRWLAVLYFKNGVDRYWRKTAPKAISEEEKVGEKAF